jgi:hypothetical protein
MKKIFGLYHKIGSRKKIKLKILKLRLQLPQTNGKNSLLSFILKIDSILPLINFNQIKKWEEQELKKPRYPVMQETSNLRMGYF